MLWNRFDEERKLLNTYVNPNFEEGSGIFDRDEIVAGVEKMFFDGVGVGPGS